MPWDSCINPIIEMHKTLIVENHIVFRCNMRKKSPSDRNRSLKSHSAIRLNHTKHDWSLINTSANSLRLINLLKQCHFFFCILDISNSMNLQLELRILQWILQTHTKKLQQKFTDYLWRFYDKIEKLIGVSLPHF